MPLTQKQKDLDESLGVLQGTPKAIAAKELAIAKAGAGARATQAAAARTAIKKVAVPLEVGLNAVEVARLATNPELREARVEEAKDLAKKGMMRRSFAAVENPVGLIYGTGALVKEARDTINDPRLREQDLAYLKWRAERDYAASRRAQRAGAQQKSRSVILRDLAAEARSERVRDIAQKMRAEDPSK